MSINFKCEKKLLFEFNVNVKNAFPSYFEVFSLRKFSWVDARVFDVQCESEKEKFMLSQ